MATAFVFTSGCLVLVYILALDLVDFAPGLLFRDHVEEKYFVPTFKVVKGSILPFFGKICVPKM